MRDALTADLDSWLSDTAGYPLGFSTGRTERQDGESHREAWTRQTRLDPCSYCGGPGGTVDHVDHRRGPRVLHGLHGWPNYAGACASCNEAKGSEKLLLWLARRPIAGREPRRGPPWGFVAPATNRVLAIPSSRADSTQRATWRSAPGSPAAPPPASRPPA